MKHNRFEVSENIAKLIREGEAFKAQRGYAKKWLIRDTCEELSIFDWWNDYLSMTQLKQMKAFLDLAAKNGYNGYVCFKVGAKGCSNGMWAHKAESTDGYSPDGEFIYHSFVSGFNYYDAELSDGTMASDKLGHFDLSLKEVLMAIGE